MLKKKIKYTDYNGEIQEEVFYFNLTKAEVVELELSTTGGMKNLIEQITNTRDMPKLIALFKKLIKMSYGEKSLDGKRFIKSSELSDAFTQTEAYSELFMELATDDKAATEFVNGILPGDLVSQAELALAGDE